MNPTAHIKSTRNRNKLIVNVSIQIPLKNKIHSTYRVEEDLISPNRFRKKDKNNVTPNQYKQTVNTTNSKNITHANLYKKKYVSIHQHTDKRSKLHQLQFSPKKRNYQTSRKIKDKSIVTKNLSILQRVINQDDNIIKYTSNSNQIKQKYQDLQLTTKIHTNVSDLDILQIRKIQNQAKQNSQKLYLVKINDFLRNACAKKIQRMWRNYKTKKLIRSYSDIRNKYKPNIHGNESILNVKSQPNNVFLKKQLKGYQESVDASQDKISENQDDNLQKWESLLQHIKHKKKLFQNFQQQQRNKGFFQDRNTSLECSEKIIKTKKYYEAQRQKWRESIQRKTTSNPTNKVHYFENELLRLQNDLSDSDRSAFSIDEQTIKKKQQLENAKLKKKLQIFKNHLPDIPVTSFQKQFISSKISNTNIDHQQGKDVSQHNVSIQVIEINYEQFSQKQDVLQSYQFNSLKNSTLVERQRRDFSYLMKMKELIVTKEVQINKILIEQLILQLLVQISSSKKILQFFLSIHKNKNVSKAEGILTNLAAIKDYIHNLINYIYQSHKEQEMHTHLMTPAGPSPIDTLKFFQGKQTDYNPDNEYIISLQLFNQHWKYANQLIYFQKRWQDQQKQTQRVYYLKQLTKVFFRAVFDCFNQALEQERLYGIRGKPYPWSRFNINTKIQTLKKSILLALKRLIKYSSTKAGILFQDINSDQQDKTLLQIKQANMSKLIVLQIKQEQCLWLFIEDQLLQIKLKLTKYIQSKLINEIIAFLGYRF